jgi:hypothetical protein
MLCYITVNDVLRLYQKSENSILFGNRYFGGFMKYCFIVLTFALIFSSCSTSGKPIDGYPNLRSSYDEFQQSTVINTAKRISLNPIIGGIVNYGGSLNPYISMPPRIVVRETGTILYLRFNYSAASWSFIERAIFLNSQGNRVEISFDQTLVNREVGSRSAGVLRIHENTIIPVISNFDEFYNLFSGNEIRVRLYGKNEYEDFALSSQNALDILEVFDYYKKLKNPN